MTIAHDVATVAAEYAVIGTQTTSHVASAAARAAVVLIEQNGTSVDTEVSGVTYGGVPMNRAVTNFETVESGVVYIYWLNNILPGTQNVAMTTVVGTSKQLTVATMTAAAGTTIRVLGTGAGKATSVANPSWSITDIPAGIAMSAYEVIHSGLEAMTNTPAASWTLISSTDMGSQGRGFARQDVASSGTSLDCGWTAVTADDYTAVSVAFYESPGFADLIRHHTAGSGSGPTASLEVAATVVAAAVAAGNTLTAWVTFDSTTITLPTVAALSTVPGETADWVRVAFYDQSSSSVKGELWTIKTTIPWPIATVVTAQLSGAVEAKAMLLSEYTGVEVVLRGTAGSGVSIFGSPSAATSGTALVAGDLVIGVGAWRGGGWALTDWIADVDTLNGVWSPINGKGNGGGTAIGITALSQHKVVTAAGVQTINTQISSTADNCGACIVALIANRNPTVPTGMNVAELSAMVGEPVNVTWTHNDPNSDAQSKYQFRYRKV